ncbi:MAG: hypothetical protein ABIE55_01655 [Candidatus Aenigmatarchaeota archaeon]
MEISKRNMPLPDNWYSAIEKSKEKARKLLNQVIAVDLNTSIVVGRLEDVSLDKLFRIQYPFCKLTLSMSKKYRIDEKLDKSSAGDQIAFVNKPRMIMDMTELSTKFPRIHEDTHVDIKRGRFG